MSKELHTIQGTQFNLSPIPETENKKSNFEWHVDMRLTAPELKHPQLIVISQNLKYCIQDECKPSLQYIEPITKDELRAIVAKFPIETPLVICYGDGQNRYRYEIIDALSMRKKSSRDVKQENPDPFEKAKLHGKQWLEENAGLFALWEKEGRNIKIFTASQIMETGLYELDWMTSETADKSIPIAPEKIYIKKINTTTLEYAVFSTKDNEFKKGFITADQIPELSPLLAEEKFERTEVNQCRKFLVKIVQCASLQGHTQMDSCQNKYEKLNSDFKKTEPSLKELQNLFNNFAKTATQVLYKDLKRACKSGQAFYFENATTSLSSSELEEKLFAASLKYLLHETAVLSELAQLMDFKFLLYKQKIKQIHHKSNSESLDFADFSKKLIRLLPKCGLSLTKSKMQYREFASSRDPEEIRQSKKSIKPKPPASHSQSPSPTFFSSSGALTSEHLSNIELLAVTTSYFQLINTVPVPSPSPIHRSRSNDSNKSFISTEKSIVSTDTCATTSSSENLVSASGDFFDESLFPKAYVGETKITPSSSPTTSNNSFDVQNVKREKIARFCCELFCTMIKSSAYTKIECLERIIDSPFNEDTRILLIEAANKKDSSDPSQIEIGLDVCPQTTRLFLTGSEWKNNIQAYCCNLFANIYRKKIFDYATALTKAGSSPLDGKYREELKYFIQTGSSRFNSHLQPRSNESTTVKSLPLPDFLLTSNKKSSLLVKPGSWPPNVRESKNHKPTKAKIETPPATSYRKGATSRFFRIPLLNNPTGKSAQYGRRVSIAYNNNDGESS